MANYTYPTQVGAIKRKDKTFAVDAKLFPEDGGVAGPLVLHAGYSRFIFSIIDKKQNIVATANVPYGDIDFIKKMTDVSIEKKPSLSSASEKEDVSKAFTVPLVGKFKGLSPGQVLLNNPGDLESLISTKKWLEENLARFPANKPQIEAIDDAIMLFNANNLTAPTTSASTSSSDEIYASEWKFLKSKPKENGNYFVYNIEINHFPANKYPYEIKITNGYAPLSEMAGGQTTIQLSKMEDKINTSILLTKKEWYILISKIQKTLNMFEEMIFKQQFDKMTKITAPYHVE